MMNCQHFFKPPLHKSNTPLIFYQKYMCPTKLPAIQHICIAFYSEVKQNIHFGKFSVGTLPAQLKCSHTKRAIFQYFHILHQPFLAGGVKMASCIHIIQLVSALQFLQRTVNDVWFPNPVPIPPDPTAQILGICLPEIRPQFIFCNGLYLIKKLHLLGLTANAP